MLEMSEVQEAAKTLGLELAILEIHRAEDIAPSFEGLKRRADALYVCADPLAIANRVSINSLALGARLPMMYSYREFVQAGRTLGMGDAQLILREILPNALPPVIVYASVVMAVAILLESALAFLRLSDANVASWGNLIGLGRDVLRVQWYVSAIPGIAILITVLAVSLVGQGLNDALNPRLKQR